MSGFEHGDWQTLTKVGKSFRFPLQRKRRWLEATGANGIRGDVQVATKAMTGEDGASTSPFIWGRGYECGCANGGGSIHSTPALGQTL